MTNHPNRNGIEKLPNGASQPLLGKARDVADAAGIKVISGPPGGNGFRSGYWTVERSGETVQVFASVSHSMEFADQNKSVARAAALGFAIRDLRAQGFPENK